MKPSKQHANLKFLDWEKVQKNPKRKLHKVITLNKFLNQPLHKLAPGHYLVLVNSSKQPMHLKNSFVNEIFWKRIIKNLQKIRLRFYFRTQSFFMEIITKIIRDLELVNPPIFRLPNLVRSLLKWYINWLIMIFLSLKEVFKLFIKFQWIIYATDFITS